MKPSKRSIAAKKMWAARRAAAALPQEIPAFLQPQVDLINRPPHYTAGKVECIDYIEQVLGNEGFVAFLRGQIIRYNHRLLLKSSSEEDAGKLAWYAKKLTEVL